MADADRCRRYRRRILEISQQVGALHIAPAFSCVEIVDTIYHELMRPQDIFIMSKGHGCMIQYVILEEQGILQKADLDLYCKPGGRLGAHPDYGVPGIQASTGSLGHGLSMAVGQAYAMRLQGRLDSTVYCLLSDGELQEGSTWEAVMMAANLQLSNLIVFVDNNDFGGLERMTDGFPAFYPVLEKFLAFGWLGQVMDGHASNLTHWSLSSKNQDQPFVVVCRTIKGRGVSFMEGVPIWHYRSPNAEEYQKAMQELQS